MDTYSSCDLLENTYLCGSNNNTHQQASTQPVVVICLKIRTFVVAITTVSSMVWRQREL